MGRRLLHWLGALALTALEVAPASAQSEGSAPVVQHVVAFLGVALVLIVVCMPSRKQ
ncbi:MAG: hypothetical protein L0Y72_04090 [Gemmataceae bacterium]|nr:hypothetical protein [Gemmataceae bacterium]MCI0638865.1 hypothetical protein [Gemmataceae bacterium]MCI0738200.1 hypothetical protein [Gemmataceae bacterium]